MRGLLAIVFAGAWEICRRIAARRLRQSVRWGQRADWCDRQSRSINNRDGGNP